MSFLGYEEARVAIAGKTSIDVVLADDTQSIDDVIVVAFGTAKKEAFTGSASVVKADEIEKRQTTNVLNALVGQVPVCRCVARRVSPVLRLVRSTFAV